MKRKDPQAALDALWRLAMRLRDAELVAIRIDQFSWHELSLQADRRGGTDRSMERSIKHGYMWRGLPPVIEHPPVHFAPVGPADLSQQGGIDYRPQIFTIECKDRRSGRVIYVSDDVNPEGYGP